MKYKTGMILLILLLAVVCLGKEIPDNMGREFILGFMEATRFDGDPSQKELKLFITTFSMDTVNVFISAPLVRKQIYRGENLTVSIGVIKEVTLPVPLRVLGTLRSSNGVYITSSDEIVVFGINAAHKSTDGFLGIPVDVLGTQYYVPSFYSKNQTNFRSAILFVGTNDITKINVRLKTTDDKRISFDNVDYRNGDWLNTTIKRFEVLQLKCQCDLTGTFVQSTHKISVFGGSTLTNIGTGTSKDHIEEQIPPVNVWGKRFAMCQVPDTNPNLIRILASEDGTDISIQNAGTHSLNSGQFYETHVSSAYYISSNKPVLTVQYVPSLTDGRSGDPAMTIIPPIEQSNVFYSFLTPKSSIDGNFNNTFIFLMEGLSYKELLLDDKTIPEGGFSSVTIIKNISTGYIKISHGSHTLKHSSGIIPFGGILYGGAEKESYAFPVGQRFTPINQECRPQPMTVGDGLDNDCDGRVDEEICNDLKDNDVDGNQDEDCVTELSTTTIATTKPTKIPTSSTASPTTPTTPNTSTTPTTPTTSTTRTTTTKQPTTKGTQSSTSVATTSTTTKLTTSSTSVPMNFMTETTTAKQQTTKTPQVTMDQIRPKWFTLTELGIISGVAIVAFGTIGVCCKKCWGLLKDRDDDDEEDEKQRRRKRRSTIQHPLGSPSIRPMYI